MKNCLATTFKSTESDQFVTLIPQSSFIDMTVLWRASGNLTLLLKPQLTIHCNHVSSSNNSHGSIANNSCVDSMDGSHNQSDPPYLGQQVSDTP